jgi:hypothetical protein
VELSVSKVDTDPIGDHSGFSLNIIAKQPFTSSRLILLQIMTRVVVRKLYIFDNSCRSQFLKAVTFCKFLLNGDINK